MSNSTAIEDYALIGDTQTAALVGKDGAIDWLCLPRFDSAACFAKLLGTPENGRWLLTPEAPVRACKRRYRDGTLVLETELSTDTGTVRLIDFMPPRQSVPDLVRIVEGVSGEVRMRFELVVRFAYGSVVPWVRRRDDNLWTAVAGPDSLCMRTDVALHGEDLKTLGTFTVSAGQRVPFVLAWHPSHEAPPPPLDALAELPLTEVWWRAWSDRCTYQGPWKDAVVRSLITLKALTYGPTGGIVAAPTTSLPENLGGVRNWDYRYCWLRDATLTLYSMMFAGYVDEAVAWREWLLRAVAGSPQDLQIMYGLAGERYLHERELSWLAGYEGSKPVRVGNAASLQLQLDVYGEVMDALFQAQRMGVPAEPYSWRLQQTLLSHLESQWQRPDEGIWEVRGPRRLFTHSRVMAWVAFDRAVKSVESFGAEGPVDRWRAMRDAIHEEVCRRGFDPVRNTFTQHYGSEELDASLLMIPQVGFLPSNDPRVLGTVRAIERELLRGGFLLRYPRHDVNEVDGLPGGEGVFLACTFWLADSYAVTGRKAEAAALFERLLSIRNDVGLLSEEYDPRGRRMLGNFPQALSHLSLVSTALNISRAHEGGSPANHRASG